MENLISFKAFKPSENTIMAALAVIVGLAGGFGAIGFRSLIDFFQATFYGAGGNLLDIISSTPWYFRILIPAIGGLIVGLLVYFFAREARGHGVPEVMEAVALKSGIIRKRIVLVKSLASAICIGSGGSVGREGPIVQIGSAIGSGIGQVLRVSADRIRTLVGCGAAAGIAATFNAPIAGSMFALEIILGDFSLTTFSPIVISSVTATAISRHFLGNTPAIIVPGYQLVSAWEFPIYVLLGLFCAIIGVIFIKVLYRVEDIFGRIKFPEYFKALLGGFVIGVMGLLFPHILGVGYGAIDLSLMQQLPWWLMLFLVFFKILSTSITIGSGGSGGVFAPSLFLGAMAGGFFGSVVHGLFPDVTATPGAYGIVGMGAIVSATTHGPLTAILMLFEMTGNYMIILPLMITCIISSLGAGRLLKDSIYTLKLSRRGVNIKAGKEINVLKSIRVKDVMNTKVDTVPENLSLKKLAEKISRSKHNSFPVVDVAGNLTAILSFLDYHDVAYDENLKDLVVAKDIATAKVVTTAVDDNIYDALEKITQRDFSILPVVAEANSTVLVGILTRRDIMDAYNKAVIKKTLFNETKETG
ncbi:MAG: chloride channel protein [Deltaproteobacteria bacterium]|nr:chloride channel protein [Deltaproteobacteria bacterium]